eukprot:102171-Chlamydomonas_euryale.AAC.1
MLLCDVEAATRGTWPNRRYLNSIAYVVTSSHHPPHVLRRLHEEGWLVPGDGGYSTDAIRGSDGGGLGSCGPGGRGRGGGGGGSTAAGGQANGQPAVDGSCDLTGRSSDSRLSGGESHAAAAVDAATAAAPP